MSCRDQPAFAQDRGPLENVTQLPHVAGPVVVDQSIARITRNPGRRPAQALSDLFQERFAQRHHVVAPLAKRGQLAYDFASGVYRWRPILDVALTDAMLGPESEEIVEGKKLTKEVKITREERVPPRTLYVAKVKGTSCEALIDLDGVITKAKCTCSFFHRMRLRAGPCRHLLALRMSVLARTRPAPLPMARISDHPYR